MFSAYSTVYPRWRGEHLVFSQGIGDIHGLSPLARGTLAFALFPLVAQRFIPAGAGNTYFIQLAQVSSPVYPRWRGEHARLRIRSSQQYGLSPLARGTLVCYLMEFERMRFIPAGAGNTT